MEKLLYGLFVFLGLGAALTFLASCSTVGRAQSSLIRAKTSDPELLHLFPQYVTSNSDERLIAVTKNASTDYGGYINFLRDRYGTSAVVPAELSITVRDRSKQPPFLPVDVQLPSKIYDFYSGPGGVVASERIRTEELIKARLYNVQDLIPRTTLHHREEGSEVFYFYPRLSLDFSAQLAAQTIEDRFSYLAVALVLQEQPKNTHGDIVKYLDFWPKGADIVEYTRGSLKQEAQLNAKGAVGVSGEAEAGSESQTTGGKSSTSNTVKNNAGLDVSYALTETFARELTDSFEQRTAGIFDNGRVFLSEFRSIKNKRIGGTYNFDLMLEVPSTLDSEHSSRPICESIKAKAYLVGVIRHVYQSGRTGFLHRIPEPDNDKVYEQVAIKEVGPFTLWRYGGTPYVGNEQFDTQAVEVTVITNSDDARFVIRDIDAHTIVGSGQGKSAAVSLPVNKDRDTKLRIEFLSAGVQAGTKGYITIEAPPSVSIVIPKGEHGIYRVVGDYKFKQ